MDLRKRQLASLPSVMLYTQRGKMANKSRGQAATPMSGIVAVLSHISTRREIEQSVLGHMQDNGSLSQRRVNAASVGRPSKFKTDGYHAAQKIVTRSYDWLPRTVTRSLKVPVMDPSLLSFRTVRQQLSFHSGGRYHT